MYVHNKVLIAEFKEHEEATSVIWVFLLVSLILMPSPACGLDYGFGTKVMLGDRDMGMPLSDTPLGTTVGFWDIGTPGYDENDPVYLHISSFCSNMITANDVRLTDIYNHSAGSKVNSSDIDMNKPLTLLPTIINYLNTHRSQAYDLEDPVYLHQFYCDPNYMITAQAQTEGQDGYGSIGEGADGARRSEFKEQIPYRGEISIPRTSCIEFADGYRMLVTDYVVDRIPKVAGIWRGLTVEVICGVKAKYYHVLNTWYVRIDNVRENPDCLFDDGASVSDRRCSPQTLLIRTNDIRLNVSPDGSLDKHPGSKVVDLDLDQNKLLESPAFAKFLGRASDTTRIKYVDANGNKIYDYPDNVYLNYPSGTASGMVMVNNVRLSRCVNASPY